MSDGLFTIAEACGCRRWYCKECCPPNVEKEIAGSLSFAADWKVKADRWFDALPRGSRFTSEDVTDAVGLPSGDHGLHRNNAVGAWVRFMVRDHRIARVDTTSSRNPASHSAVICIWQKK